MIFQRHLELNEQIRERGCYLMSILYHVERLKGHAFEPQLINEIYDLMVQIGVMMPDCYILQPDRIFGYFGVHARYNNRHDPPQRMCAPGEIEILKFTLERPTKNWDHFVAGDGTGGVVYDPWGKSRAVADGYLANKRIFKVV